jgi:hypothetical protein
MGNTSNHDLSWREEMLLILADVYRIATFRRDDRPTTSDRPDPCADRRKRKSWLTLAGLRL